MLPPSPRFIKHPTPCPGVATPPPLPHPRRPPIIIYLKPVAAGTLVKPHHEIGLCIPPLDLATIPFQRPIFFMYYALKFVSHPRQPDGDFREITPKSQDVFPFELMRK